MVIYTGTATRSAKKTSPSLSKVATLDLQVNLLAKVIHPFIYLSIYLSI